MTIIILGYMVIDNINGYIEHIAMRLRAEAIGNLHAACRTQAVYYYLLTIYLPTYFFRAK